MALQSSGAISLNDIAGEFGGSTPHSISEYYGAASGIPSSGTIDFADFYGASAATIPTSVNFWVVGGGGGGGNWGNQNGGGGGGAGGNVVTGTYSSISSGETFNVVIGAGGNSNQTGGVSRVYANNRSTISANGGGHGASRSSSGSNSSAGCSGGGSRNSNPGGVCFWHTLGAGGNGVNGLSTNMVDVHAGGGGGGANGTTGGNAQVNFMNQAINGLGGAGLTLSTGVSTALVLGKGGDGGVSHGARMSSGHGAGAVALAGFNTLTSSAGETNRGGGGGGGARHTIPGQTTITQPASSGGSGVVIMQYTDTGLGPSSITGSYTLQQVNGYRTYIFTSGGSMTW